MVYQQQKRQYINNAHTENSILSGRIIFLFIICLLLIATLLIRIIDLQLFKHEKFSLYSDRNRLDIISLAPSRSNIYDRNGKLLATNHPSFNLEIHPKQLKRTNYTEVLDTLSEIVTLDENDKNKIIRAIQKGTNNPLLIKQNISEVVVAQISARLNKLPGVRIKSEPKRYYPYGSVGSHVIGYTDIVKAEDIEKNDPQSLRGIKRVGRKGIEAYYDTWLRGKAGYATIEQDVLGNDIREITSTNPTDGMPLTLSIDIQLQQYIEELISPFKGSVVVVDTHNGEVLSLVSMPNYDLNLIIGERNSSEYKTLIRSLDSPFLNRAINGQYSPGSTFKPFIALAGMEKNKLDPNKKVFAGPYYQIPGKLKHKFYDWKDGGHGWVNLDTAIAQSCDVYFYDLAYRIGIDDLHEYLSQFYFGSSTGIDLPNESAGLLPYRAWKKEKKSIRWYPGETVIFGIGQGYLLTTPLQMAVNMSAIANRGRLISPKITLNSPTTSSKNQSKTIPTANTLYWNKVTSALHNSISKKYGTAHKISSGAKYSIAGKTGTVQVFQLSQDKEIRKKQKEITQEKLRDHSVFTAFAPVNNPRISIAVVIENGGSGSSLAAPIARDVMDKYFELYPLNHL